MYTITIYTPQGCPGGSTDPGETKEFEFLGFRCDHEALEQLELKFLGFKCDREGLEQLEPKNCSKTGIFDEFRHFLMSFLVPVALNLDGHM